MANKTKLPFPIDPAFDYIVTPEDWERFAPKLATDELYFSGSQVWRFAANNETFGDSCIYRRRKEETNPASLDLHKLELLGCEEFLRLAEQKVSEQDKQLTQLRATIDAQASEVESLKLQNAGLHTEFMRMAQQIAVLGGDKASLQSTIDAQKEVIEEAEKALKESSMHIESFYIDWDVINPSSPDYDKNYKPTFPPVCTQIDQALAAIRKLEDGK